MAAMHYLRGHFEDATEVYRKMSMENREYLAINVYIALCYYKLDYFDVSLDILGQYKNTYPTSVMAQNLVVTISIRLVTSFRFITAKPPNRN